MIFHQKEIPCEVCEAYQRWEQEILEDFLNLPFLQDGTKKIHFQCLLKERAPIEIRRGQKMHP